MREILRKYVVSQRQNADIIGQNGLNYFLLVCIVYSLAIYALVYVTFFTSKSYTFATQITNRLLGLMFFVTFISVNVQMKGLVGEKGIIPVKTTIELMKKNQKSFFQFPTFFFFNQTDTMIQIHCYLGILFSSLIVLDILTPWMFFFNYWIYLSLKMTGREWFALQFDHLLLETAILSTFLNLNSLFCLHTSGGSHSIHWALWWLLLRMNFCSGILKICTGDKAWRSQTALFYHYFSQPMPNFISYYAHLLPPLVHKASCVAHFVIELAFPFGLFFEISRVSAALGLALLQIGILVTGNYGVFNWVTIILALSTIDDQLLGIIPSQRYPLSLELVCFSFCILVLFLSFPHFCQVSKGLINPPQWMLKFKTVQQFFVVNYYGLFGKMTTQRHEVVIEGSNDGRKWMAYEFKFKPGDTSKRPPFVSGHLPRLDWRMWFLQFEARRSAAVDTPLNAWFESLLMRLLEGSKEVLAIMGSNPFPDSPPQMLRVLLYEYQFADRSDTGWWKRSFNRKIVTVTIRDGEIRIVENGDINTSM